MATTTSIITKSDLILRIGWGSYKDIPCSSMSLRYQIGGKDSSRFVIPAVYYDSFKIYARYRSPLRVFKSGKIISLTFIENIRYDQYAGKESLEIEGLRDNIVYNEYLIISVPPIRRTLTKGNLSFEFPVIIPEIKTGKYIRIHADRLTVGSISINATAASQRMTVEEYDGREG